MTTITVEYGTKTGTWRNKLDVTTFYFSRFPAGIKEEDLWKIFQKWGKVWEVFIPKYKNKEGQRFGFVRFKNVQDERKLELQLDANIYIGSMKLFVNKPRYDRGKRGDGGCRRPFRKGESSLGKARSEQRTVVLSSHKETNEWLQKAWIGRLKNRGMFERLEEELQWILDGEVNPCYWADDWIFLPYLDDSKAERIIHEEKISGSSPVTELQKWSPDIRPDHRLTWVRIWGLPPAVWAPEIMQKVVEDFGEMVEVDGSVEDRRRMDVARILIRTNKRPRLQEVVLATIDGETYHLDVLEEMPGYCAPRKHQWSVADFPPSPFSTPPNTPILARDSPPATPDGGSDHRDGESPSQWGKHRMLSSSFVQWIKPKEVWGEESSGQPLEGPL
ncbi:hypothetical protein GYH30_022169 [Glycine max]|uniref:RRM domain-containing protein n=1 Tax=Glycine max TaxID=3847 RepID=K7L8D9_SOYBN|nr:hypothetical protein GYH30_022169 [Glycine max]